jgi:glycosyltransferase involved in cell wall biosynthesis
MQAYATIECADRHDGMPFHAASGQRRRDRRMIAGADAGRRCRVCLVGIWPGVTGADFAPVVSPGRPRFAYAEAFDAAAFRVVDCRVEPRAAGGGGRGLVATLSAAVRLWRAQAGADVVVAHPTPYLMLAVLVRRLRPALRIITIQYERPPRRSFPASALGWIKRALYRRVDRVLCLTPSLAEYFTQAYALPPEKLAWLPFGVDTAFFRPGADAERKEYVLVPGNHRRDEAAVMDAARSSGGPRVVRVTNAPWVRETYRRALDEDAHLAAGLTLERSVSAERLRELYQRARLVWLPLLASREPAGLTAALEAAACGCPLLVSRGPTSETLARLGIRHIEQSPAEPTRAALAQALRLTERWDPAPQRGNAVQAASVAVVSAALRQQVLAALAGAGPRGAGNVTSAS